MSSSSVADTKNNLSAILASLSSGMEQEHVIRKRNQPIAVIKPYVELSQPETLFGFAKDEVWEIDWDAFDALDAEIAMDMGL